MLRSESPDADPTSAGADTLKNGTSSSPATACANKVLPQPGGPCSSTWAWQAHVHVEGARPLFNWRSRELAPGCDTRAMARAKPLAPDSPTFSRGTTAGDTGGARGASYATALARDPPTFSRGVASGDDNGGTRGVSYAAALARDAPTFTRSVASGDAGSARGASHAAVFLPAFDSSPSLWGMHLWDQFVLGVAAGRQNFTQSVSSRR